MKEFKLSEIASIENGGTPSTEIAEYWNGDIPWITPYDLSKSNSKYIKYGERSITRAGINASNAKLIPARSIMVSTRAPIGYIVINETVATTNQGMKSVIPNRDIVDAEYLYYLLKTKVKVMNMKAGGTTFKEISTSVFKGLKVMLPSMEEQKAIGYQLSKLDEKIEQNNKLIANLNEYSQLLFHKWFIGFNFPDVNGKPYKDTGGEIVIKNGRTVPKGWEFTSCGNLSINFDSKRVPLSENERTVRQGEFPYYGATDIMDYIDSYIFDGNYCLIAEDGSVIDKNNKPIMQYVTGKFWVNNHAHVLQGNGISTEFLYLSLQQLNVMGAVTGAIQKKINQTNLNKLPVILPDNKTLNLFDSIIQPLFKKIELLKQENTLLSETRDLLIAKLIK